MSKWRNIGIGKKLLLVNLLVVVLPSLFLYFFISHKLVALMSAQYLEACTQTVAQAAGYLQKKLTGMANISDAAFYDPDKYLMISQNPRTHPLPEQLFDAWRLRNFVHSLTIIDSTITIHMYVNDDLYYANEEILFHPLSRVIDSDWLNSIQSRGLRMKWLPGAEVDPSSHPIGMEESLSVVRRVVDQQDYFKTMAVLRVDLPLSGIVDLLANTVVAQSGQVLLLDETDRILAKSNPAMPDAVLPEPLRAFPDTSTWQEVLIRDDAMLVSAMPVGDTGLRLLASFPKAIPRNQSKTLRMEFLLLILGVMATALLVSIWFTGVLSSRLRLIMQRMRHVQHGRPAAT